MRLPRDVSGESLARMLGKLGYREVRQTGSHIRVATSERGAHRITIPKHTPLRVGTLARILADVAEHFDIDREELLDRLHR